MVIDVISLVAALIGIHAAVKAAWPKISEFGRKLVSWFNPSPTPPSPTSPSPNGKHKALFGADFRQDNGLSRLRSGNGRSYRQLPKAILAHLRPMLRPSVVHDRRTSSSLRSMSSMARISATTFPSMTPLALRALLILDGIMLMTPVVTVYMMISLFTAAVANSLGIGSAVGLFRHHRSDQGLPDRRNQALAMSTATWRSLPTTVPTMSISSSSTSQTSTTSSSSFLFPRSTMALSLIRISTWRLLTNLFSGPRARAMIRYSIPSSIGISFVRGLFLRHLRSDQGDRASATSITSPLAQLDLVSSNVKVVLDDFVSKRVSDHHHGYRRNAAIDFLGNLFRLWLSGRALPRLSVSTI